MFLSSFSLSQCGRIVAIEKDGEASYKDHAGILPSGYLADNRRTGSGFQAPIFIQGIRLASGHQSFLNPPPLVEDLERFDRASDISLPLPWRGEKGEGDSIGRC
jgi:hypothetical protein